MKAQILTQAVQQLKTGGYESLSFGKIAEELSISRANVHHHFQNKEKLAIDATQAHINESYHYLKEMATRHHGNYKAFLIEVEAVMLEMVKTCQTKAGCICSHLIRDPGIPSELTDLSRDHFNKMVRVFKEVIESSQNTGTLKNNIGAQSLATQVVTIILGVSQMALAVSNIEDYVDSIQGILLRTIQD